MVLYDAWSENRIRELTNFDGTIKVGDILENLREAFKLARRHFVGHQYEDSKERFVLAGLAKTKAYEEIISAYMKLTNMLGEHYVGLKSEDQSLKKLLEMNGEELEQALFDD